VWNSTNDSGSPNQSILLSTISSIGINGVSAGTALSVDFSAGDPLVTAHLNHLTGWSNGDFNYDGVVDGSDYSLIDNAFNQINATGAAPLAVSAALSLATQSKKAIAATTSVPIAAPIFADSKTNAWKLYIDAGDNLILS